MTEDSKRTPRRRRKPLGRSLEWSDEAIAQAAQVGPQDADAAGVWWDRFAPKEARTLLEAVEDDDEQPA